ncbi:hypothetical protein PBY51_002222 [Eleginops maclovinus]|uniref:HAT C-terminal dimerisation domain-containing protein n=1 Tax=Eleginops maclovinus TaxID=56733 RepID=A0AAN8A862_ELEMC|nr:hypothetical protein PBY51_002222 [Eleginops maclovinus]
MGRLSTQLGMLPSLLAVHNSCEAMKIKRVTQMSTAVHILSKHPAMHATMSEVCQLLRIYLTIPLSSATAERSFSCRP